MPISTMPAAAVLERLSDFDTIIDARSEAEHALDHLPGAVNWPTLHDDERVTIGTLYKQVSAFEAKKRGAALAARNIAAHIEREVLAKPKDWKPLVYCWRGGNRSGALATILGAIGFQVTLIEGGYKAWRAALVEDLPRVVGRLSFRVVCGPTGSGKTRLLHALRRAGAQVLDLEDLANHRSSVLGQMPGRAQPSQKRFESLIWETLSPFRPDLPVYVECESKKVGNLRVPDALIERMRASPCLELHMPEPERVALLMEDYTHFVTDPELFCERLAVLTEHRGHATVAQWQAWVRSGRTDEVVQQLLQLHYDPAYGQSMRRNFSQYAEAEPWPVNCRAQATWDDLARQLLQKQ